MTFPNPDFHPILKRQVRRFGLEGEINHPEFESLIQAVSNSYFQADQDRYLLERSLTVSSSEMQHLHNVRTRERDQLHVILQSLGDGLCVIDIDGKLQFMNPAAERLLGHTSEEWAGKSILARFQGEKKTNLDKLIKSGQIVREENGKLVVEQRSPLPVSYVINPILWEGAPCGAVVVFRDISERKALEEQLRHQAFHDSLTGLANRALFHDRVRHALARSSRNGNRIGVMYIDLDNFKIVNDGLGHAAGDALLMTIAERLKTCVRQVDTVARLGGDEFALLIEEVSNLDEVKRLAERILNNLSVSMKIQSKSIFVGASIGIAVSSDPKTTLDDLLRNADTAMYSAKNQGKGCFEFFDPCMHSATKARMELEADLATAVGDDQFVLFYQPTVSLNDGSISGVEALIRWKHPKLGLIPPLDFIPLAEESGLILPIGQWVLREACRQGKEWQRRHPHHQTLTMCVNLSVRQLRSDDFVEEVAATLRETNFPPSSLVLELTESMMLEGGTTTTERLHALRNLGVRLAIDDFGTGYSSLGYLRGLPVDILKVDKSFVQTLSTEEACPVLDTIVALASKLNLQTVVEGVETERQKVLLHQAGCHLAQGYYFARPAPGEVIENALKCNDPVAA